MPAPDAVVLGASGFAGGELVRLLLGHPQLRLTAALSDRLEGQAIADVHANLAGATELCFEPASDWSWAQMESGTWTIFSALPHRETAARLAPLLEQLGDTVQLIDLSGDHRLDDAAAYKLFYGSPHPAPDLLPQFVYGLPELNRERISSARLVANPGCFATAAALALLPAAAAGWPVRFVAVDGKTGSSGAGARLSQTTHHPYRANSFQAYRQLRHQHLPEITGAWQAAGGSHDTEISFVPHMAPMVRGIFVTAHLFLESEVSEPEVKARYQSFCAPAPFMRLVDGSPAVNQVWGSNRCDLSVTCCGRTVVVCAAIDNLVKGAAGQAIQNANLMNGWNETAGLLSPAPWPV
jgi:N-acetyl-gamma-glutamyl-phosphate reductase